MPTIDQLPLKSSLASTDQLVLEDSAGQSWKVLGSSFSAIVAPATQTALGGVTISAAYAALGLTTPIIGAVAALDAVPGLGAAQTVAALGTIPATPALYLLNIGTSGILYLPTIAALTTAGFLNYPFTIKDATGKAFDFPITFETTDGELIDGETSVVLNVAYGALSIVPNSFGWSIV